MTNNADPRKILIYNDGTNDTVSMSSLLSREGYCCLEGDDPSKIHQTIIGNKPDALVLNTSTTGLSGFDLLLEIVQRHPDMPVIIVSGEVHPKIVVDYMKAGARDYLAPPFESRDLIVSVNRVIELTKLERKISEYHSQMEQIIRDQKQEIRALFLGSIESLFHTLEFKDKYTAGHARRVTELAVAIGRQLDLQNWELDDLRWGALLHDVGKVAIESSVQNKPEGLTQEEYRHVMTHPAVGADIISRVANPDTLKIVLHHHDRYDGTGLYQTLKGDDIPFGARIVAVADSFDAITSSRPYRPAKSIEYGINEIKECSGTQFDPKVVDAFLRLHDIRQWEDFQGNKNH
jgi:putative two-component system response regulator